MKPRRRSKASERIALSILEKQGYDIIETNKKVVVNGVEVSEVDALVRDRTGQVYAVEVKAGRIDVSAIRQAVINAQLLGAKPLIVGKGYSDDAARVLAEELGVKTLLLEDLYIVDPEDLEEIVAEAVNRVIAKYLEILVSMSSLDIDPEDEKMLQSLVEKKLEEGLGTNIEEIIRLFKRIKDKYPALRRLKKYSDIRLAALLLLLLRDFRKLVVLSCEEAKQRNTRKEEYT